MKITLISPPAGPAAGSFNGLHQKSNFLAIKFSETGRRRSYRRMITSAIPAPTTCGAIPLRVVSTSGSSGMAVS